MRALLSMVLWMVGCGGLFLVPVVVYAKRLQGERARSHFPRPRYL